MTDLYGNGYYNQQNYQQDLVNMRDRIERQLQQIQNYPNQPQQTAPITQNFQLAPTQGQNGIKYVDSIDDVKKEFVIADSLFVNKSFTQLWRKYASGDIKTYTIEEIIELDEKDVIINDLKKRIDELEKERIKNEPTNDNANVNGSVKKPKPSNIPNNSTSNE